MKFKSLALAAISALVLSACGGGGGGGGSPAIDAALHIKGTVDGVVYNGTDTERDIYQGLPDLYGRVTAPAQLAGSEWNIYKFPAAAGTYDCHEINGPFISLERPTTNLTSSYPGGSCKITVIKVDNQEVVGTFVATLIDTTDNSAKAVTNGSFRLAAAPVLIP